MVQWKRISAAILALAMAVSLACTSALADTAEEVVLPAAQAVVSGEGVSFENKVIPTAYDAGTGTVANMGKGSTVTYTVPEGVNGVYDIYLTVSKCLAAGSSAPFGFSLNGETPYAFPLAYQVGGDSPFAYNEDGEYDVGHLTDTGRFRIQESVALKAGDTITITGMYGCRSAALADVAFPNVGDILLAKPGAQVATGYDNTVKPAETVDPSDPLSGLNIIWLGSSVTFGAQAGGYYSMADAIADNHAATTCEKYAINGTTLVNTDENSYVARLRTIDPSRDPDLVIIQLSTNDATSGKPYGEMTDSFDPSTFDDETIIGAMETLISYVRAAFDCPVLFYTGSYYESEEYGVMVHALLELQEKWGFGVIDLYNNADMTAIYDTELYHSYMYDNIHPNRKGYIEWWTPAFEAYLSEYVTQQAQEPEENLTAQTVWLDGAETGIEAYYMEGAYYLKLRDAALALAGGDNAFGVTSEGRTVQLTTGGSYESTGGEYVHNAGAVTPEQSTWSFTLDGEPVRMDAFSIGGYHFCCLSDLAHYFGFSVGCSQPEHAVYLVSVAVPEEEPTVSTEIPAQYTKMQTVVFEKLGLDVLVAMNEDESAFYMTFNAFGDDQMLYGTIADGAVEVEYDLTGFFTNDAPAILAGVQEDAWTAVPSQQRIPEQYTKFQTVMFEKLDLDVLVAMSEDESAFYMSFNAFGDDQELSGTIADGTVTVEYDKTGFFTNDAPAILAGVQENAWCSAAALNAVPEGYTKYQSVVFEKLALDVLVLMNEEETQFCLSFNAFGDDQLLYGAKDGDSVTVEYDKTGFFTNDAPAILGGVDAQAWQTLV